MVGKAREIEWYRALEAFADAYGISNPVEASPKQPDRYVNWDRFSKANGNPLGTGPVGREKQMYAFAQGYAGSRLNVVHPLLVLQACLNDDEAAKTLTEIREAFQKGREAARTKNQMPPLENIR